MGVIFDEPGYPVVTSAPKFWQTIGNFNTRDVGIIGGLTAISAPYGHVVGTGAKISRSCMFAAMSIGALAGFCLAYQNSAGRLMGFLPNDAEVEAGLQRK